VGVAGIVVNNISPEIDTYQEFAVKCPIRSDHPHGQPLRTVLLTPSPHGRVAPMMFGLSLDFAIGGYTIDSPQALGWKQLATAVSVRLGIATVLTAGHAVDCWRSAFGPELVPADCALGWPRCRWGGRANAQDWGTWQAMRVASDY